MTFFNNAEWIGYLAENLIRKCITLTESECSGCRDKMKSSILHLHIQLSLLEKIQNHFEAARGEMLHALKNLYKEIEQKLPHSDDKDRDENIYLHVGRFFLLTASAQTIYYGRYINEMNDLFINEVLSERQKTKSCKKKKV